MRKALVGTVLVLWGCNGRSSLPAARPADAVGPATCWQVFLEREGPRLRRQKLALVAHRPTRTLLDSLLDRGFSVVRVYAPEHGLFGEQAAGHRVRDTVYRGVPVVSLYGQRKAPSPAELAEAEAIVFALRDVGVRHYTYLSTLALVLGGRRPGPTARVCAGLSQPARPLCVRASAG
ncbi:MAG: hypothetical protein KatS3mg026_0779 [Bacteroidia bacterium]|nr:MAG: hypothetical protein KatS3mg026_0779 [Bacteroidia bacterium]